MKTWNDVSVAQWQQLIQLSREIDLSDDERGIETISILSGMTRNEITSLDAIPLAKLAESYSFVYKHPLNPDPVKFVAVNGRRYKVVENAETMPSARYIETKYFAGDVEMNLHRIAASMVIPMKRGKWFRGWPWTDDVFNPLDFEIYSNDMLDAKITDVLGSVVFFCAKLKQLIESSPDYWVNMLTETLMMNPNQIPVTNPRIAAETIYQILCNNLGGFTTRQWLPNTNV